MTLDDEVMVRFVRINPFKPEIVRTLSIIRAITPCREYLDFKFKFFHLLLMFKDDCSRIVTVFSLYGYGDDWTAATITWIVQICMFVKALGGEQREGPPDSGQGSGRRAGGATV